MDIRDLRSRIDSIKQQGRAVQEAPTDKTRAIQDLAPGSILLDHGWKKVADMVYEKTSVIKNILPEVISEVLLGDSVPAGSKTPASQFIFYDTETTGLSAGAGNIVFLAGFGESVPGNNRGSTDFKITQLFLSDFPGEPDFLEQMQRFISPDRIYVSYNGKSFDANLLRSRYTMNGMKVSFGYQLDLLYSSRRLWKNIIGACSLGDIEREVLDKHRTLDVPGFMVPDLYFDFIRAGGSDESWKAIEGVMAHHLEDIASLAELLAVHEQLISEAGERMPEVNYTPAAYFDHQGLASLLMNKRPEAAAAILKKGFDSGNKRAGTELSLYYKRSGRWKDAVDIWEHLWNDCSSIFAGIELAKYYEHRKHDIETAFRITEKMLSLEHFRIISVKFELKKRLERLVSKKKGAPPEEGADAST